MNIAKVRQLNQQLVSPEFTEARDVVRWMVMIQAQDYASVPWAVGVRMKKPSLKRFTADFNAARIVRTHLFRNTVQLVAATDLPWMQMLYRDKALAVEHSWVKTFVDIDNKEHIKIKEEIMRMLEGNNYLTKAQIDERLRSELNITLDNRTLIHLLRVCEFEGQIVSGPQQGRFATFALQSERIASPVLPNKEEAMTMLARRYFMSHAPATLNDFAWWSSMTKADCTTAMENIKNELERERVDGVDYYLHHNCRTTGRGKNMQLLPPYDEYLIGYKSRHHVLPQEHTHKAHNNSGIFWPILVKDGQVVGNWNKALELTFFEEERKTDFTAAIKRYNDFLTK